jgi:(p)ppGpp synthase/HD superfamily hydrolase
MNLDKALEIAVAMHAGQQDKAGAPYILHPLRVLVHMATDEERIVAALHDVVEDSQRRGS